MIATYFKGWQGSHTYYHMTKQVQNRVDILLLKYRGDISQLVQKSTQYFVFKKSSWYFTTCTRSQYFAAKHIESIV